MSTVEFTPFTRSTVGFDRIFDLLERAPRGAAAENYPPYKLGRMAEEAYHVTLAVPGFTPDELTVTAQANLLVVAGKRAETKEGRLSTRASPNAPSEVQKPQRIAIAPKPEPKRIESEAAA